MIARTPVVMISVLFLFTVSCQRPASSDATQGGVPMSLVLHSSSFANGSAIPRQYTCDGANLSPALTWTGAPGATQSLALVMEDPDAPHGTWTHWLVWNIPPRATVMPEGEPPAEMLDNGARQGSNDFHRIGYGGPCPPAGRPHRYVFRLLALNIRLDLKAGARRTELDQAMRGHILVQSEWMGTYAR